MKKGKKKQNKQIHVNIYHDLIRRLNNVYTQAGMKITVVPKNTDVKAGVLIERNELLNKIIDKAIELRINKVSEMEMAIKKCTAPDTVSRGMRWKRM